MLLSSLSLVVVMAVRFALGLVNVTRGESKHRSN